MNKVGGDTTRQYERERRLVWSGSEVVRRKREEGGVSNVGKPPKLGMVGKRTELRSKKLTERRVFLGKFD